MFPCATGPHLQKHNMLATNTSPIHTPRRLPSPDPIFTTPDAVDSPYQRLTLNGPTPYHGTNGTSYICLQRLTIYVLHKWHEYLFTTKNQGWQKSGKLVKFASENEWGMCKVSNCFNSKTICPNSPNTLPSLPPTPIQNIFFPYQGQDQFNQTPTNRDNIAHEIWAPLSPPPSPPSPPPIGDQEQQQENRLDTSDTSEHSNDA